MPRRHPRKRIGRLDVNTEQGGVIAASDRKNSKILAADAAGLKQHTNVQSGSILPLRDYIPFTCTPSQMCSTCQWFAV